MKLAVLALLGFWTAGQGTWAQQQEQPAPIVREEPGQRPQAPTLHIESRLVTVALNVTDEQGAPVPGLTQDDFTLKEDGKPQKIAFFDKESKTPLQIVIAIDGSESTYAEWHLERDAARNFVRSLVRPQDSVEVMSFSDQVDEIVPFTSDVHEIESGLGHVERGDATAMYDAITLAGQKLAEQPSSNGQRRVLVLITDGENTAGNSDYASAIEQVERSGAMVYSLIVVPVMADAGRDTGGEHALIQMSRDTGGKYYEIFDKHDLAPAFARVSDDLRTQYMLGYYAPHKPLDEGGLRHIEIELKPPELRGKYKLRYRTAYYIR